jgi:hypothetical protein
MAYTFDYGVIEAVTAFMNGDELTEEQQEILSNLADTLREARAQNWVTFGDPNNDPEYEEVED